MGTTVYKKRNMPKCSELKYKNEMHIFSYFAIYFHLQIGQGYAFYVEILIKNYKIKTNAVHLLWYE